MMRATRALQWAWRRWFILVAAVWLVPPVLVADDAADVRRLLYVASPGVRNYVEYGGHGVLVFDIDQGHQFVRRIPMGGLGKDGKPLNVKGICASADTDRLYVSTLEHLICIDLATDKQLWERTYEGGCDRMAISPDGTIIYLPTLEKDHWKVVDAATGDEIARVTPDSGAHNTVYGSDGRFVYLAGLRSPLLTIAETASHTAARRVGPFTNSVRPFTVNAAQTRCYVCINDLLGFEVGDITTGKKLVRVEVPGFEKGPVKRHGCPSHGIGLTPDESEIWVSDATNQRVHVFDATVMPPQKVASIELRDEPGWVTFTIDGTLAYPSTGEVIDTKSREIVATLTDEEGRPVMSEKMLEIDFRGAEPVRAGDQFGIGRKRES
jgi:DNA-binding beta-propeller fold protein YncE